MTSYFGGQGPGSSEVLKDVSAPAFKTCVHVFSPEQLVTGRRAQSCGKLSCPSFSAQMTAGDSLPMSKPSYFPSMGGVFLVLKIISFSHSLYVYTMLLFLLCLLATLTSFLSVLNASFFLSTWQSPHQPRLWRDWGETGCIFVCVCLCLWYIISFHQ